MTKHAIILDFDGTLADTMPQLAALGVDMLIHHYGLSPGEAYKRFLETVGAPFYQQLETLFHEDSRNHAVSEEFSARKLEIFDDAVPFDDAAEAIQLIRACGWPVYVCSSTEHELVTRFVQRHRLLVTAAVGTVGADTKTGQIMVCASAAGLKPEQVVFIGDAPADAGYAYRAGARFLAVEHTFERSVFAGLSIQSVPTLLDAVRAVLGAKP